MDNKLLLNPKNSKLLLWKKIVLGLIGGIILVFLGSFGLAIITILIGTRMPEYLEIDSSEVPIYTNAQNVLQEEPITEDITEVYSWSFSSSDAPDIVWQFYVDEMSQRWGFYDASSPQSIYKSLMVHSCPFYYLEMTSTQTDSTTYNYIIKFSKELCR